MSLILMRKQKITTRKQKPNMKTEIKPRILLSLSVADLEEAGLNTDHITEDQFDRVFRGLGKIVDEGWVGNVYELGLQAGLKEANQ